MVSSLFSELVRGAWSIDPNYVASALPLLQDIFTRNSEIKRIEPVASELIAHTVASQPETKGNVAVINLQGPLTKYDQECGPRGMLSKANELKAFFANPQIAAVVLFADTPGGSVAGIKELVEAIDARNKPVIGFGSDMVASAGVHILSATDEIIMNTELAEIGSIGVMASFADVQPMLEKQGIVFHEIYSSLSKNKNKDFADLRKGNYDEYIKNNLDPVAQDFIDTVKKYRSNVTAEQLDGKMFFAKDVIGSLIDSIGSFEYALDRALLLSENYSNSNIINSNQKIMTDSKQNNPNVNADADAQSLMDHISSFFKPKKVAASDTDKMQTQIDNLAKLVNSDNEAHRIDIEQKDAKIKELEIEIEALRKTAGAQSATVVSATDGNAKQIDPRKVELDENLPIDAQIAQFVAAMNQE